LRQFFIPAIRPQDAFTRVPAGANLLTVTSQSWVSHPGDATYAQNSKRFSYNLFTFIPYTEVDTIGEKMTQLQMKRAARAAGAQPRAIAMYRTGALNPQTAFPLAVALGFSGLLWTLFITRVLSLFA
jgi:hypothetical protein